MQVIIVGDLNVAASQADVHKKLVYGRMYSKAEKEALQALLRDYTDIWRQLHPDVDDAFTVWDEKTSARVFNEVCFLPSFSPCPSPDVNPALIPPAIANCTMHHLLCSGLQNWIAQVCTGAVYIISMCIMVKARSQKGSMTCQGVLQGVRIDYALISPGLLQRVVSCEIVSNLPPKWSDHAALLLELKDIPAAQPHPPCALSSLRMKRFAKPKASIASMFAKRLATDSASGAQPSAKRARTQPAAAAELQSQAAAAPSIPHASQAAGVSEAATGDEGMPDVAHGSNAAALASMHAQAQSETAAGSNAGVVATRAESELVISSPVNLHAVSLSAAQELTAETRQKQDNTTRVDSSRAVQGAASDNSHKQTKAKQLGKVRTNRNVSNPKEGPVPPSPKQKSIRGFFAAQQ